jgi:molybdopterin synthase catalytic subunit
LGGRSPTMAAVTGPEHADDWVELVRAPLPVAEVSAWVVRADCGAVVSFSGTARDHAEGRDGVTLLEYEAYEEHAIPRMQAIVAEARRQWPVLGRVALIHAVGPVPVGQSAVVVAASAPHRHEAFEAARFLIDAVKATVPIWKRETWADGQSWGLEAQHVVDVGDLEQATPRGAA